MRCRFRHSTTFVTLIFLASIAAARADQPVPAQTPPQPRADNRVARPAPRGDRTQRRRRSTARSDRRRYPKVFDLRPRFYRGGAGSRSGVRVSDQRFDEELERAYQQGLADGRRLERLEIQADRGQIAYEDAMAIGQAAFRSGDYALAARQLLLAATLNQGDPASRLAAAHAHTALGDYSSAARLLRRAFELQPRLIYLPLDPRGAYGRQRDLADHIAVLRKAAAAEADAPAAATDAGNPGVPATDVPATDASATVRGERWFLLGYYLYYTDAAGAANAFDKAADRFPDDRLIARLAELAHLTSPRTAHHPAGDRRATPPNP